MKNEMTDAEMLAEALRDTLKCLAFVEEMIIPDVDARRWAFQTLHGEPAQVLAAYESRKAFLKTLKNASEPPCPTCKGTGEISVDLGGPTFADEDCPDCSGDKP